MATRNWMGGLLSLLLVGTAIYGVHGTEPASPLGTRVIVQPEEPLAPLATANPTARVLTYKGRTFQDWSDDFQYELDPAKRISSLKALVVFGSNGKAGEVVTQILTLLDGYRFEVVPLAIGTNGNSLQKLEQVEGSEGNLQALGFLDEDDVELFQAAAAGLYRLGSRAISELSKYATQPGDLSAGKLAALLVLRNQPSSAFVEVLPDIVEQNAVMATYGLGLWREGPVFASAEDYRKCIERLLKLKDPGRLSEAIESLTNEAHKPNNRVAIPMLKELVKTNLSVEVRETVERALQKLEKSYGPPATILPASDGLEKLK